MWTLGEGGVIGAAEVYERECVCACVEQGGSEGGRDGARAVRASLAPADARNRQGGGVWRVGSVAGRLSDQ